MNIISFQIPYWAYFILGTILGMYFSRNCEKRDIKLESFVSLGTIIIFSILIVLTLFGDEITPDSYWNYNIGDIITTLGTSFFAYSAVNLTIQSQRKEDEHRELNRLLDEKNEINEYLDNIADSSAPFVSMGYAQPYYGRLMQSLDHNGEIYSNETIEEWRKIKNNITTQNVQGNIIWYIPKNLYDLIAKDRVQKNQRIKELLRS